MKKTLLLVCSAILIQLQAFSQFVGPQEVCPNVEIEYAVNGYPGCVITFNVVTAPATYTVVDTGPNWIKIKFSEHFSSLKFKLRATIACGGSAHVNMDKEITVKNHLPSNTSNLSVACGYRGNQQLDWNFSQWSDFDNIAFTTNLGWVRTSYQILTPAHDNTLRTVRVNYAVSNDASGYIKIAIPNQCANLPTQEITYNFSRTPGPLPAPTFINTPDFFCIGSTSTAEVQAVSDATQYIWTSNVSQLKVNGLTTPVTTTTPNVSLSWASHQGVASLKVKAVTPCGETPQAEKKINGGPPQHSIYIEPFLDYTPDEYCTSCILQFQIHWSTPMIGATSYQWKYQLESDPEVITAETGTHFPIMFHMPGNYLITATPYNSCGFGIGGFTLPVTIIDPFSAFSYRAIAYPNPSNGVINIMIQPKEQARTAAAKQNIATEQVEVWIYDHNSQLLKSVKGEKGQKSLQINTSGIKPGNYLLQIKKGKEKVTQHIVIN